MVAVASRCGLFAASASGTLHTVDGIMKEEAFLFYFDSLKWAKCWIQTDSAGCYLFFKLSTESILPWFTLKHKHVPGLYSYKEMWLKIEDGTTCLCCSYQGASVTFLPLLSFNPQPPRVTLEEKTKALIT